MVLLKLLLAFTLFFIVGLLFVHFLIRTIEVAEEVTDTLLDLARVHFYGIVDSLKGLYKKLRHAAN